MLEADKLKQAIDDLKAYRKLLRRKLRLLYVIQKNHFGHMWE